MFLFTFLNVAYKKCNIMCAFIVFLLDSVGLTITEVWVVFKTDYRNQLRYQQKLGKYSKEIIDDK